MVVPYSQWLAYEHDTTPAALRGRRGWRCAPEVFATRGWSSVPGLRLGRVGIDCVVVTPSGVLAAEAEHRGTRPARGRDATARRARDLALAQAAARKVRSLLYADKLLEETTVFPVLMVWDEPDLPAGHWIVDGVYILDVARPQLWSHLFAAPLLDAATLTRVQEAVQHIAHRNEEHRPRTDKPLRQHVWQTFRHSSRPA